MKKTVLMLATVLACGLSSFAASAAGVNVSIDGIPVVFNDSTGYPFVDNARTLVPLRATMESFGAEVDWDQDSQTAFVRKDTTTVRCKIWENCIYRNNVKVENDAAAVIVGGKTYLPIRAVLEAFGAEVNWDGSIKVTSPTADSLIFEFENTPSVTTNFWNAWNEALALKSAGNYAEAINKIRSISSIFIQKNDSASNAMLFKHLGECYSNLKDYTKASACFKREAYYWSITAGMEESRIDAQRRAGLIRTSSQIYIKSTDRSMGGNIFFGEQLESQAGIYLGAYAEGDTNIYNPYNPSQFYMDTFPALVGKDMAGYLLYLPYGQDISHYQSHIEYAKSKNKILQIALEPHLGLGAIKYNDQYLRKLATDMQNSGCRMMIRIAGEMNDPGSEWYTQNPEEYIEKFRVVAGAFHQFAPSVPVIWAPNHYPSDTMDDYYPGDAYVDYVGISSYMMHQPITDPLGQGVDRSRWSNQLDKIYSLYGHKKPIIIAEGGASYMDYDTWADITPFASRQIQDFYTYLPIKYPNVKMSFLFESNRERQKFSLSDNASYLAGYQQGIQSDLFLNQVTSAPYRYDYYEIGNNVKIKAEPTELVSYITTPTNDTAYVIYSVNGVDLGTAYAAPYKVPADFSGYRGQKVNITARSFDSSHTMITTYTVTVNVI